MIVPTASSGYLTDTLLVATRSVNDGCFDKTVIYICAHNQHGAMGVIVNMPLKGITVKTLLDELDISHVKQLSPDPIYFGGPIDTNQGFVIHTDDQDYKGTTTNPSGICFSAGISALEDIAQGRGPAQTIITLGYAGWAAGQLEDELQTGSWITVPATYALLFDTPADAKWAATAGTLGVDLDRLSSEVGHA